MTDIHIYMYIYNINIHNRYIHNVNMYILILVLILIHININMYQYVHLYLLLLLERIYYSRFCCFAAPIGIPNNDNTLFYVNHTQLKYQNKNEKVVKI